MNPQLLLNNIRGVLTRLEDSIIFALLERAQFKCNQKIYQPACWPEPESRESIMGFLLRETEKSHALLRRYTSPDEHPFCQGLPAPILPELRFDENPLRPNQVNLNHTIRSLYEERIIPFICQPGDDSQYGSSAVCDVHCLQTLSRRIHYGKFVAECKYRDETDAFLEPLQRGDREALHRLITDERTEQQVLQRVKRKAVSYGGGGKVSPGSEGSLGIEPEKVAEVYRQWIIPLTKQVEVLYLLQRQ